MAAHRSALVDASGFVLSVIMRDDAVPWDEAPVGITVVDIPSDSPVGPRWTYDGADFTAPPDDAVVPDESAAPNPQTTALPLSGTSGVCTGDLDAARTFTITPTGPFSIALINVPPTGTACVVTVAVEPGLTAYPATFPPDTTWVGGEAPATLGDQPCVIKFETHGTPGWVARADT